MSGWQKTYKALHSYLDFLDILSNDNQMIAKKLINQLQDYTLSWIQWGYFSTPKGSNDRKMVEQEIKKLIIHVGKILAADPKGPEKVIKFVKKKLRNRQEEHKLNDKNTRN